MTRAEIVILLREFIRDFRIDPHDAGQVLERVDEMGGSVDAETLGDYLEMVGYPKLAEEAYARGEAA